MKTYPPKEIMPEGSENPGAEYPWTVTAKITLADGDRFGRRLYPDGEADAYYDFEDERWHWSDYTGGPSLEPESWKMIEQ